jgi:hypothetical protein
MSDDIRPWQTRLKKRLSDWSELAANAELLCEIAVPEDDLGILLGDLRSAWRHNELYSHRLALAVAVVNWADHGGHDREFAGPFMQALTGFDDASDWEEKVGSRVEAAIRQTRYGPNPRRGAWRYVGLILEHAGLLKRHIPAFARLVRTLRDETGWDATAVATDDQLCRAIGVHLDGSSYAEQFLCAADGLALLRRVCRCLLLHGEGLLSRDRLDRLPDLRPGFLNELLTEIERQDRDDGRLPVKHRAAAVFTEPEVVFDSPTWRLVLRFDPEQIHRFQTTCNGARGPMRADIPIGAVLTPASRYGGVYVEDGRRLEWSIEGWPAPEWSLFDLENGRLIAAVRQRASDSEEVPPGDYRLVVWPELQWDRAALSRAEEPWLNVGGSGLEPFEVHQVCLSEAALPPFLDCG